MGGFQSNHHLDQKVQSFLTCCHKDAIEIVV